MSYFETAWLPALLLPFLIVGNTGLTQAQAPPAEIAWALHSEPKTLDPAKVDDQSSEMVRYLTGGVLLRVNRQTLQTESALAERWLISKDGRLITFRLRKDLHFSDGSSLTERDVVASLRRVLDPATAAPVREEFLEPQSVTVGSSEPLVVQVHLAKRIVALEKIFDEIAIEPAVHFGDSSVTAGPFHVTLLKRGDYVMLQRNAYYWRKDATGHPMPYLNTVRLDTVSNREIERVRFLSGQYQLIDHVAPEDFDGIAGKSVAMHDYGPSLNTEQMWFNQAPSAPIPAYEKSWFTNRSFRLAISLAIRRADLARIAYKGHATPAYGFISPANRAWHNANIPITQENTQQALQLLQSAGFHLSGEHLLDHEGHSVHFSILTNAGNLAREKMAELIKQDLRAIGIEVNVVRLDFPALIERLMHTQAYEAALLGLSNVDPDPNAMINVWLSSSPNHQWNPSEKTPATDWEAEIDRLMLAQAATQNAQERKRCIDRLQQIVADQQPFIYLVHPNLLYATSMSLEGTQLSVLQPGVVSAIDSMRRKDGGR